MSSQHYNILGTADGYARLLSLEQRRRHLLVTGQSDTGTATLLANLFAQEANSGRGVLLIDPSGDLAEQVLDLVPSRRIRKTLYFNPSDRDWPVAFNVLDDVPPDARDAYADHILAIFHAIWADSWGQRMQGILYNAIRALLDTPGATLLGIYRMLLDADYRKTIVGNITNPVNHNYWTREFPLLEDEFGYEATSPVLVRVQQLFASSAIRNVVANPKTAFHPRHLIDNNYIVIVNLSKGALGQAHTKLLGCLLIAAFGIAAQARHDVPADARKDFAMIIDGFTAYTTSEFPTILEAGRRYHLSFVLAHQTLGQMAETIRETTLGQIGNFLTFSVSASDAEAIARIHDWPNPDVFTGLPAHSARVRIGSGISTSLDSPAPPRSHAARETIVRHSRIHFATERAKIEPRIHRFLTDRTLAVAA